MTRPVVRSEAVKDCRFYRLNLEAQQRVDSARGARGQVDSTVPREIRALTGPGARPVGSTGLQ